MFGNNSIFFNIWFLSDKSIILLGKDVVGMSCPSWQWHRTGSRWSPVRTLLRAYWWRPCGVTWDSSQTGVVIRLRQTSALGSSTTISSRLSWLCFERFFANVVIFIYSPFNVGVCNRRTVKAIR